MPLVIPPGIDAEGAVTVAFVPTLANPSVPKLTELTATGALDISCYLTKEGFGVGAETETSTDERLCSKEVYETLGKTTWSIENLVYIWNPQGAPADLSQKAYDLLKEKVSGYLVVRWGKDAGTALAVGDKVDVFPVTLGAQVPQRPEANSKLKVEQRVVVTGPVRRDVALVA